MYLSQAIVDKEGRRHPMAGILPGTAVMGRRLASLGYCSARCTRETYFGPEGSLFNGHVFHWSEMTGLPSDAGRLFTVSRDSAEIGAGDIRNNVIGSWLHIHFASNPQALKGFVRAAVDWKRHDDPGLRRSAEKRSEL
jgi:cobyrinic acid a,c-diamide synthase